MNADEYRIRFLAMRDRISHGPLKNVFFCGLQPCWDGTGRFGDKDIVYQAVQGNEDAAETLKQLLEFWQCELRPQLNGLVCNVAGDFGFVASEKWPQALVHYESAADIISRFRVRTLFDEEAHKAAADFWNALDVVKTFVADLRGRFGSFFSSWNPELIRSGNGK